MPSDVITLRDMASLCPGWVSVSCNRCDRRGKLRTRRVLAEHGPDLPVPTLRRVLAADCPKMIDGEIRDVCGIRFPDLQD